MNACICGCKSYSYKDHGIVFEYSGIFGRPRTSEEVSAVHHTRPPPVYCTCDDCGKRFKLSEVRGT